MNSPSNSGRIVEVPWSRDPGRRPEPERHLHVPGAAHRGQPRVLGNGLERGHFFMSAHANGDAQDKRRAQPIFAVFVHPYLSVLIHRYSRLLSTRTASLADDLDQHPLRPVAVELAVEDLLPRAEVELALR